MPDEKFNSLNTILEEIILINKIENSLAALKRGEVLAEGEMDKLVDLW